MSFIDISLLYFVTRESFEGMLLRKYDFIEQSLLGILLPACIKISDVKANVSEFDFTLHFGLCQFSCSYVYPSSGSRSSCWHQYHSSDSLLDCASSSTYGPATEKISECTN